MLISKIRYIFSVARRMLTKEEKEKVETRIAKLEAEIAEDKLKDKMIDDDMEQMVQTTLTVYEGFNSMFYFLAFSCPGHKRAND